MIAAISTLGAVLWWAALGAFFLVVVPVVIAIASRVVWAAKEIRDYAHDVLDHGVGLAGNLDPVPELITTRDLVREAGGGLGAYGQAVGRLLEGNRR